MCLFQLLFFSEYMPSSKIAESYGSLISSFIRNLLLSTVVVSTYIPTDSARWFPFLHILSSIWYIYNGILLGHKKEWIWVSRTEVDETKSLLYREKKVRNRKTNTVYINTYIWNLEKQYRWTYLQGVNRDIDTENRLADTAVGRRGGTNWESIIETCITIWKIEG